MTEPRMTTYSLAEAAVLICGTEGKTDWVAKRLRRGEFPGYKSGRLWRMTENDVAAAIESLRPRIVCIPDIPVVSGLTRTSARRMSA